MHYLPMRFVGFKILVDAPGILAALRPCLEAGTSEGKTNIFPEVTLLERRPLLASPFVDDGISDKQGQQS